MAIEIIKLCDYNGVSTAIVRNKQHFLEYNVVLYYKTT